jgi:hypothetical protein
VGEARTQKVARNLLAGVRLGNGALGLAAPQLLAGRVEAEAPPSAAAIYAFRMFGIRTVLLGVELLVTSGSARRRALRRGVLIHGSDTASAAVLALSGRVATRKGALLTAISATNVVLALIALGPRPSADPLDAVEVHPHRRMLGGLW